MDDNLKLARFINPNLVSWRPNVLRQVFDEEMVIRTCNLKLLSILLEDNL